MSDSPLVQQPFAVCIQTAACDLISVREASQKVCAFLGRQGLHPEEISSWELLCAEAGNNAVLHVQPGAEQKPVVFLVLVFPTLVEIQVVDHTAGFDFPEKPELPDPTAEHGRGLFLMRTLSDQAEYLRGRAENRLVLIRKRTHPAISPAPVPNVEAEQAESMLQTMSEELSACYESLSAIFRFTEEINKGGQDARFIARWLDELRSVCAADWWILRLAVPGGTSLVQFASSRPELLPPVSLVPGRQESVEGSAATGRQDIWLEPDVPLPPHDPLRTFGEAQVGLSHPIHVNGTLLGVMTLGRPSPTPPFTAGQVSIIHTFADFLGLQIHNSRILEDQLQSRLLSRDLEIAASIQRSLLPVDLPAPRGFRVSGHSASASQVGGDFYDVLEIPDVGLLFAIADVMGKGVPAAMFAAVFRGYLRSRPELAPRPAEFLTWLNWALFPDLDRVDMFVTAQLVFLDLRRHELKIASAGHCPLLMGGGGREVRAINADGPPLGITAEMEWTEQVLPLPPGSGFVLYTDGLIEARNSAGDLLGIERVQPCLEKAFAAGSSANGIRDALLKLNHDFLGGIAPTDDVTLLVLASDSSAAPQ